MYQRFRSYGATVPDFSEQFLISCNADGFNCENGGSWCHRYHFNTVVTGETQAGAIAEATMPYVYTDGSCTNHPYNHTVKLSSDTTYIASDSATIMANIDKVNACCDLKACFP